MVQSISFILLKIECYKVKSEKKGLAYRHKTCKGYMLRFCDCVIKSLTEILENRPETHHHMAPYWQQNIMEAQNMPTISFSKTFPKKLFQPKMDSIPEIYVDPTLPPIPIIKHGYENMCKLHHKQKLLFCKFCETNEVCYSLLHFSHSIFSLSCNDVLQRSTIKA